jgi:F-type H+-transporting ATPase subunit d
MRSHSFSYPVSSPIETLSELSAFRARHAAALTKNNSLTTSTPTIDLAKYKSILKDQQSVQNAEKVLSSFKPVTYDLGKVVGVVDAFEGRAVEAAKATVEKISSEEKSLSETLSNIKDARPFEDLTVGPPRSSRLISVGIDAKSETDMGMIKFQ